MVDKLTIVLPAYNAERTIRAAIEGVLRQTMPFFKLVIVDDGSTDATAKIADEFAEKDARVIVIHQKNQGCYSSRVNGLKLVNSQYFGFMDADDDLLNDYYERMIEFLEKNNLDVVQCDIYTDKPDTRVCPNEIIRGKREVFKKVIRPRLIEGRGAVVLWDKIYKRSLIPENFIPSPVFHFEDIVMNWQLLKSVNNFGYLHQELYGYMQNFKPYKHKHFEDFIWTDRFRREHASVYGLTGQEIDFAKWTVHNAKNFMMVALRTYDHGFAVRCKDAREIVSHEQVKEAFHAMVRSGDAGEGMRELALASSWKLPFWAMLERIKSLIYPLLLPIKHTLVAPKRERWV